MLEVLVVLFHSYCFRAFLGQRPHVDMGDLLHLIAHLIQGVKKIIFFIERLLHG